MELDDLSDEGSGVRVQRYDYSKPNTLLPLFFLLGGGAAANSVLFFFFYLTTSTNSTGVTTPIGTLEPNLMLLLGCTVGSWVIFHGLCGVWAIFMNGRRHHRGAMLNYVQLGAAFLWYVTLEALILVGGAYTTTTVVVSAAAFSLWCAGAAGATRSKMRFALSAVALALVVAYGVTGIDYLLWSCVALGFVYMATLAPIVRRITLIVKVHQQHGGGDE